MKSLLEFLPLAAFLIAYYLRDVYAATAALMVAMPLMLLGLWLLTRQVGTMPLISTILVLVFGTLTLLLHDPRFNVMDGLDTYIDDYSKDDPIPEEMLKKLEHAREILFGPEKQEVAQGEAKEETAKEETAKKDGDPGQDA